VKARPPFSPATTRRNPANESPIPAQAAGEIRSSPTAVANRAMKMGLVPMTIEAVDAFITLMPLMKKT
jgi:hypothetical protein